MPIDPKDIYVQACDDFRSLNGFLWQTPLITMTLTGGLWFSVANFELTDNARRALLIFAGVADLLMIVALVRLRFVMKRVQTKIRALEGAKAPGPGFIVVGIFSILLLMAATGSFFISTNPRAYFTKRPAAPSASVPTQQANSASYPISIVNNVGTKP